MKKLVTSIVLFSLLALIGTTGIAQETPQQQRQTMKKGMGMGMGMGKMDPCMMGNMSAEQRDKHMRSRQSHMLQMHDLSNKILAAENPNEKENLKGKQLELMKTHREKMMAHKRMMKQHQGQMRRGQQ